MPLVTLISAAGSSAQNSVFTLTDQQCVSGVATYFFTPVDALAKSAAHTPIEALSTASIPTILKMFNK